VTHPFRDQLADVIDAHAHDSRLIDRETALGAAVEGIINEFIQGTEGRRKDNRGPP
jgi:hypothetical protein